MIMDVLHYVSGPLIGCAIGAFTNYIAIKMLFRPLKPVKIGKHTLPLTPGIIPRHQEKLADSLSDTVYKNFFTNSDIEGIFMSDEMASRFSDGIYNRLSELDADAVKEMMDEDSMTELKKALYIKIHTMILSADLPKLFETEMENIINSDTVSDLLSRLIFKDEIASKIAGYAGQKMTDYLMDHDLEIIWPLLNDLENELRNLKPEQAADIIGLSEDMIKDLIKKGYFKFMESAKSAIADGFHMKQFIYDKIMELDPAEIEKHVNNSIKREMNYLVYLGGFLGLLIGVVNIFI